MYKKYYSIFIVFFISVLSSQELDQSFLNSLPADMRKDLIEANAQKDSKAETNYNSFLYSSKLQKSEELLSLKERLESDLQELERRLQLDDEITIDDTLKLFGSEFFSTFQTSFMPINEPNPSSDYFLDIGDVLSIELVGQQNSANDYELNNDGSIFIEDIGRVYLAGLSLKDSSSLIQSKITSSYIGTQAFVSLSKIRNVNVLITGNAENPGIYTLPGNSNILHAISVAGGISEFGSFREINQLRNSKVIETLDIYDLLIYGKYNIKSRLRSGDVIFVEPKKGVVTIDGAIHRPA